MKKHHNSAAEDAELEAWEEAADRVNEDMPGGCTTVPKDWYPHLTRAQRRMLASTARGRHKKGKASRKSRISTKAQKKGRKSRR